MANLTDIIAGITYPEKTVIIPTDFQSLSELGDLELSLANLSNDQEKEQEELTKARAELVNRIQESTWTFTLRGLPSSLAESVARSKRAKIKDPQERINAFNRELIVLSTVKVVGPGDEPVDFAADSLNAFLDAVPGDVVKKFQNTVDELSGDSLRYEILVTDPNFS